MLYFTVQRESCAHCALTLSVSLVQSYDDTATYRHSALFKKLYKSASTAPPLYSSTPTIDPFDSENVTFIS
jgi:hypothetical protein